MKFLLDQGVPRSTVRQLASAGIGSDHIGDLGLSTAADQTILDLARQSGAVVVTYDADFHQLLAVQNATAPSVIRLRIEGLKGDEVAALLLQVIHQANDELLAGAAVSVTQDRIRVRTLPIVQ